MPKKITLSSLILLLCFQAKTQINFQKGYFIDEQDQRTECLIKDVQSLNTPVSFTYKINETSRESFKKELQSVKEFGYYESSTFQKFAVEIDRTGYDQGSIDFDIKPHFENDTLFLELLIDGPANLYQYIDGALLRFFYKTSETSLRQLVYKKYKYDVNKTPRENKYYFSQLSDDLKCSDINLTKINETAYNRSDLESLFIHYNTCKDPDYLPPVKKRREGKLNLSFKAGPSHMSFWARNTASDDRDIDSRSQWRPTVGLEVEYVLPIRNNKWAITFEPFFLNYYSEQPAHLGYSYTTINTIVLPLGIRHYLYFNDKMKIYLNPSLGFYLQANSRVDYDEYRTMGILMPKPNLTISAGFKHADRYSIDICYGNVTGIMKGLFFLDQYRFYAIKLGYQFFTANP